jgi:hypothetical protein
MNEKIKKLARRIAPSLPESDSLQSLWERYKNLISEEQEYFSMLNPDDLIKVFLGIHSLKLKNDFSLAEKNLNNIFFSHLLSIEDHKYYETCPECGGYGTESCNSCDGRGNVTCGHCGGDGEVGCCSDEECAECDGKGEKECDWCDGEGKTECRECDGEGNLDCDYCGGNEEIETDNNLWDVKFICSWNKNLKSILELKCATPEVAITFGGLQDFDEEILTLENYSGNSLFGDDIDFDGWYCLNLDDESNLKFRNGRFRGDVIEPEDVKDLTY